MIGQPLQLIVAPSHHDDVLRSRAARLEPADRRRTSPREPTETVGLPQGRLVLPDGDGHEPDADRRAARSRSAASATSPVARRTPRRSSTGRCTTSSPGCRTAPCSATAWTGRSRPRTGPTSRAACSSSTSTSSARSTRRSGARRGDALLAGGRRAAARRDARLGHRGPPGRRRVRHPARPARPTSRRPRRSPGRSARRSSTRSLIGGHVVDVRGQHRHRVLPAARPRDAPTCCAGPISRCTRPSESGERPRRLRRRAGGPDRAPADAAERAARRHPARRARPALPAQGRPRRRAGPRGRGAGALAATRPTGC